MFEKLRESTPCYIVSEQKLRTKFTMLKTMSQLKDFSFIFPLKPVAIPVVLNLLKEVVSGFSVSSLNESILVRKLFHAEIPVFLTSPAMKSEEVDRLANLCDHISFNSLGQLARFGSVFARRCKLGLRVNPGLSFVKDKRYNPCRKYSKLGVTLDELNELVQMKSDELKQISGISFHNNCESDDFADLLETIHILNERIPAVLQSINWINIGGGYSISKKTNWDPFLKGIRILKEKYNLKIYFEPGKGIIGDTIQLISSVQDIIARKDKLIAILDTSVNHMPEVFEYQYRPSVLHSNTKGKHRYILAGASCLAGDIFGEYSFDKQLEIGSKIVFEDMGAYTLVKAHMFNGINLPTIYLLSMDGELELIREYDYEDFLSRCGAKKHDTIRKVAYDIKAS